MKKLIGLIVLGLIVTTVAIADSSTPISIDTKLSVKQGMVINWRDAQGGVKNLSTVSVLQTNEVPSLKGWQNALWTLSTVDFGWAYDASSLDSVAVLWGLNFGNLGKYIPVNLPALDKLNVTVYPMGMMVSDVGSHPCVSGASGVGIIKFDLSF